MLNTDMHYQSELDLRLHSTSKMVIMERPHTS